ncbi:MAG: MarR family transcriptional regulator [Alphaproteobacteria bacterium]|nr:MarR family transcriptional regulator [Alphaproteobacteria bacterium]
MQNRGDDALLAIRRILRTGERHAKSLVRDSGLSTSQRVLLHYLVEHGAVTASEIARAMSLSQATVTTLVDRLEEKALAVRSRSAVDRRQVFVSITPEGQGALQNSPSQMNRHFLERFAALPDWEQAAIVSSLERVAALLDEAAPSAPAAIPAAIPPVTDEPASAAEEA